MRLAQILREKRVAVGLTIAQVAELSGHPKSEIASIEYEEIKAPRFHTMIDIGKVLGLSLDEIAQKLNENGEG